MVARGLLGFVAYCVLVASVYGAGPTFRVDPKPIDRTKPLPGSMSPIVKKAAPSVVSIFTTRKVAVTPVFPPFFDDPFLRRFWGFGFDMPAEQRVQSLGSGVIVTEDGYILTSHHVIEGAEEIKIALADEKVQLDATVVGTDPQTDIAVLKVQTNGLPAIVMADSDTLEVGDVVLAIGNPFGVGQTVTRGIVSAKGRNRLNLVDYEDFIQTDAAINPGNSGGALVDLEGRLVGINTAIYTRSGGYMGIGFAVPVNLARYVCERIITDGKVVRGYLGVLLQALDPELAGQFKLPDTAGALVAQVLPDSPAARAGLKEGDVILEFNGKKVQDIAHLRLMVAQTKPGTKVSLKVLRDERPLNLQVTLGEQPKEGLTRAGLRPGWFGRRSGDAAGPLDGVTVDDLTPQLRERYGIPPEIKGAVVTDVAPDCPAAGKLKPGCVIMEIDRKPVRSADEAVELSGRIRGDSVLLRIWVDGGTRYVVVPARKRATK